MGYDYVVCRDLRKLGFRIGRKNGSYELNYKLSNVVEGGNEQIPDVIRESIQSVGVCALCHRPRKRLDLFPDHKIPRAVVGNEATRKDGIEAYQPACRPCNNRKAQECQTCANQDPDKCLSCFWASPADYDHWALNPMPDISTLPIRVSPREWSKFRKSAAHKGQTLQEWCLSTLLEKSS